MFDNTTDEDDMFFPPTSSSNLASLFGVNTTKNFTSESNHNDNATLTYTAPKQPKKLDESTEKQMSRFQSNVLIFKEVYSFKLVEKNYVNQGKCGCALIGNDSIHLYQLILYKQKNDVISSSKITPNFKFYIQKDNYASFTDDTKSFWTIHFSSEDDLNEFSGVLSSRGIKVVENNSNKSSQNEAPSPPNTEGIIPKSPEPRSKTNSIKTESEDYADVSNTKANILTRMAKMGQKLFPHVTSDTSDNELDVDKSENVLPKNKHSVKPQVPLKDINLTNDMAIKKHSEILNKPTTAIPTSVSQQHYALINGQYVPIVQSQLIQLPSDNINHHQVPLPLEQQSLLFAQSPKLPVDLLQMHFSENRTHNSEIRINLVRLTNKMEEVLERVNKVEQKIYLDQPNESLSLVEENDKLKTLINRYTEKEKEHLKRIKELEESMKQFDKKSINSVNEEIVKKIMNTIYNDFSNKIQDEDTLTGKDIKKLLGKKIVHNTISVLTNYEDSDEK